MLKAAYSNVLMPRKKGAVGAVRQYLAEIGRTGGQAKVKKGAATLTPEARRALAKKGAAARWAGKKGKNPSEND